MVPSIMPDPVRDEVTNLYCPGNSSPLPHLAKETFRPSSAPPLCRNRKKKSFRSLNNSPKVPEFLPSQNNSCRIGDVVPLFRSSMASKNARFRPGTSSEMSRSGSAERPTTARSKTPTTARISRPKTAARSKTPTTARISRPKTAARSKTPTTAKIPRPKTAARSKTPTTAKIPRPKTAAAGRPDRAITTKSYSRPVSVKDEAEPVEKLYKMVSSASFSLDRSSASSLRSALQSKTSASKPSLTINL